MKISVIIPTCNRARDLEKLLDSIAAQTLPPAEVVVVDQSDDDETRRLVALREAGEAEAGVRYVYCHRAEKGSAKARNAGFHLSSGDIVSFTDDDVVLDSRYLESIAGHFDAHPEVGGISGNVRVARAPSGFKWVLRKLLMRVFLIDRLDGRLTRSGFGFPLFFHELTQVVPVELFSGYSMNFRRRHFELEPFDEWFTGYSFREDVEQSYRVSRRTRLEMLPDAKFVHNHSSANRLGIRRLKEMQLRNYRYVFEKHAARSAFSRLWFYYSLGGFLLIDFIEFVSGLRRDKWHAFSAECVALVGMLRK